MEALEKKFCAGELKDDKEGLRRFRHYMTYRNLYIAAEHQGDLKYLGSKWNTSEHEISTTSGSLVLNFQYFECIRGIKIYLYPKISEVDHRDSITLFLEENDDLPLDCRICLNYINSRISDPRLFDDK